MYKIFRRSATNFDEFSRAKKVSVCKMLTLDGAIEYCRRMNQARTEFQIKKGTKFEFTEVK